MDSGTTSDIWPSERWASRWSSASMRWRSSCGSSSRRILLQLADEVLQRFHYSCDALFVKFATAMMVSWSARRVHSSTQPEMWVSFRRTLPLRVRLGPLVAGK